MCKHCYDDGDGMTTMAPNYWLENSSGETNHDGKVHTEKTICEREQVDDTRIDATAASRMLSLKLRVAMRHIRGRFRSDYSHHIMEQLVSTLCEVCWRKMKH